MTVDETRTDGDPVEDPDGAADRPSDREVFDALNEPRPDLAGPVLNDDESPLATAAAAELARAEAIEQSLADAIEEPTSDAPEDSAGSVSSDPVAEPGSPDGTGGDEDADEVTAPAQPAASGAWSVLGRALKPRMTRAQVLAAVLCAMLGFALVVQVRQASGADLSSMRQQDLVRILDEVTNRSDALANESADLTRERDQLLSGSDRRQAALDALRRSAETQGILTGRLPAEGPGVVVTLTDPSGSIKPSTMLDVLEELRNAGAEAIELNDQRVTASSAFTGAAGAVVLDGTTLDAPYTWTVIGDPDTIDPALQIPGGAMAQVRNDGGHGDVEQRDTVQITALRVIPDPVYATPVPPTGG
ncbi:DUF881 domain-containing protein [Cellulomonas sp. McL0617]|uniref:DUF881 domain-containing protein n=1 Tax=Cellulomonas sp. McL0617 TaxID=3415675 RepID=UPI003CED2500